MTASESDSTRPADTLAEGRAPTLGKYEIVRKIGTGGMGSVYLAQDTQLKRTVALKVLPREKARNPILVRRFQSEAESAAQLRHDNIVTIYEAGEEAGYLYLALEFVDGTDVHAMLAADGPFDVERSIDVIRQAARALEHACERGIVHRDIKPSNLLVTREGTVKLTDMGLARSIDETAEAHITRAGTTVGTVDFMAPEQARSSKAADVRSDMYSLGCTWYQMLTGRAPFTGSLTNKLFAHASRARPDPRKVNPNVPQNVVDLIQRMMARSPKDRFQTPADLLQALDGLGSESQTVSNPFLDALDEEDFTEPEDETGSPAAASTSMARPPSSGTGRKRAPGTRPGRAGRESSVSRAAGGRNAPLLVTAGVLLLGLAGLGGWWLFGRGGEPPEQDPPADSQKTASVDPSGGAEDGSDDTDDGVGTNPFDDGTSDAGADDEPPDAATPRDDAQARLPDWVANVPTPAAVREEPGSLGLPIVNVGRTGDEPADQPDLATALASIPEGGALVRLRGPGPFFLPSTLVPRRGRVVVAGAAEGTVVWCQPREGREQETFLEIDGGSLVLMGLDLVADAGQLPERGPVTFVSVLPTSGAAELILRDCSVTLRGERAAETVALRCGGGSGGSSRVLLQRTFVRGNGLAGLVSAGGGLDAAVSDSLLATGTAPAVRLAATKDSAARSLRVLSSRLAAQDVAFDFSPAVPETASTTHVEVADSVVGTRGPGASVLVRLGTWPLEGTTPPDTLTWTGDDSLYLGWKTLVSAGGEPAIRGASRWQRFWGTATPPSRFQPFSWPANPIEDAGTSRPADYADLGLADGTADEIAATVSRLREPAPQVLDEARAWARRPLAEPPLVPDVPSREPLRFDLDRIVDFGLHLRGMELASGTTVIVSGKGVKKTSPIRVGEKWLRIEFEGEQLEIQPRSFDSDDVDRGSGAYDALFSVSEGGRLELVGGRFKFPSSDHTPAWFLLAEEGDFSLERCTVRGPARAGLRYRGLIRWNRPERSRNVPASPYAYERRGRIVDCLLSGQSPLLSASLRGRALTLQNSVFTGGETLFDLDLAGFDGRLGAVIDARRCTFSAAGSVFHFGGTDVPGTVRDPLQAFVVESLVAPLPESAQERTVLMRASAPLVEQRQIVWRGRRNAYADSVGAWLLKDEAPLPDEAGDARVAWVEHWGKPNVRDLLAGEGAVRLAAPLPELIYQRERSDFRLAPTCRAASWSSDGKAVGASQEVRSEPDEAAFDDAR